MNLVMLYGRLTKDMQILKAENGNERGVFTLAVPRGYKNPKTGKYEADFVNCVIFNSHLINLLQKYTGQGTRINVNGKLQINSWQEDGNWINMTQVIVNEVGLIDTKEEREEASNQTQRQPQGSHNQAPRTKSTVGQVKQNVDEGIVTEDDLPF